MTIPKLEKREEYHSTYERYKNQDVNLIYKIVYGWLFKYRDHRNMDKEILGKKIKKNGEPTTHGNDSKEVLLYLGLDKEWKKYFKENNISIEEAISELKSTGDSDYADLINILENVREKKVTDDEKIDLSFNDAFKIVADILLEKNGIELNLNNYDGLFARKLSATDAITENRPVGKEGAPTHIAVTGEQRNMFPYLMSYGYFTEIEYNQDFKSYFVFKAPVFLNCLNLTYLYNNIENEKLNEQNITAGRNSFESINSYLKHLNNQIEYYGSDGQRFETSVSVLRSRKLPNADKYDSDIERRNDRREDQIELSQKRTDGEAFLLLRRLLFAGDYLIILKQKSKPTYDMYGIKQDNEEELSKLLSKFFYDYTSNKKSTSVPPYMFEGGEEEITEDDSDSMELMFKTNLELTKPRNLIYFGAPGTGKSYELNKAKDELLKDYSDEKEKLYERVTFHPDYSYANFVGSYKPISEKIGTEDGEEKNSVTYDYVPGPFMRLLVKALRNAKEDYPKPFLLIIEEINRSNVSAVFGEVFQLLDRNKEGVSEYSISTSKDMQDYFVKELGGKSEDYSKIKIPNNMFIWATMNSADQGVFPVDTAFKRRWNFEYIELNHDEDENPGHIIVGKKKYVWNNVRNAINNFLIAEGINEDKCMGAFFIKDDNADNYTEMFRNKVLMYLFEDLRSVRKELFADNTRLSYSKILKDFDNYDIGLEIFNEKIWKGLLFEELTDD